jgi:hypothetical protein
MRRRKPWVFARRRLLGWNVRLLTRGLPAGSDRAWHREVPRSAAGRRPAACGAAGAQGCCCALRAGGRARRSGRRRLDRATVRACPAPGQTRPTPPLPAGDPPSSQVSARLPVRHAGDPPDRWSTDRKILTAGCGQPLAGRLAASLVSRGSPGDVRT